MIRSLLLFLSFARVGLFDWFGSPWRSVAQVLLPVLYVLALLPFTLDAVLEQPAARVVVADVGPAAKDLRPVLRGMDYIVAGRLPAGEAQRRFEQSQFDAVLTPVVPPTDGKAPADASAPAPAPDRPTVLELQVRDGAYFLWPFLARVIESPPSAARILLDPLPAPEKDGTPVQPVAAFFTLLLALTLSVAVQQIHHDRLGGWTGFLRITPVTPGFAMTGLAFGRILVTLGGTAYTALLLDLIIGLPTGASVPALAAVVLLGTVVFGAVGSFLGLLLPAYRGSAETFGAAIWPLVLLSPVFWNVLSIPAIAPVAWVNPVTPAYDLFRLALGGETVAMGAGTALLLLAGWTVAAAVGITLLGRRAKLAEARA